MGEEIETVAARFYAALVEIVGTENARSYSGRFMPLGGPLTGTLYNFEGLAFYVYTTGLNWHEYLNAELWKESPNPNCLVFRDVLNAALEKIPLYRARDGLVFRGFQTRNIDEFLEGYKAGRTIVFPGFTSASFAQDHAFGGNVLFIIKALTARAAWYVAAAFHEYEVLIPAGRLFHVRDVQRTAARAVILMDEIE